jgi:hypothetical protein
MQLSPATSPRYGSASARSIGRSRGDDPPENVSQARLELLARDAAAALEVLGGD